MVTRAGVVSNSHGVDSHRIKAEHLGAIVGVCSGFVWLYYWWQVVGLSLPFVNITSDGTILVDIMMGPTTWRYHGLAV